MSSIDPRALRNAFGAFMTGVTVVTARDSNGQPIGFTANSFTSVSLDPPLVLVCLANSSKNYEAMVQAEGFAVNILAESQMDVSNTFARPVDDRFAAVTWRFGPHGAPVIDGVCAWFDCKMHKTVEAGDHVILIGEVQAFDNSTSPGLGYARGAYVSPSDTAEVLTNHPNLIVSALIERDGNVLLVDDGRGGQALPEMQVSQDGASATLQSLIAKSGLAAEPGFVYSVYDDADRKTQHISFLCQAASGEPANGAFVPLETSSFEDVTDPASLSMLERLTIESQLGNFGTYFGNQVSGDVRPVPGKGH